jgi:hypothetical protein
MQDFLPVEIGTTLLASGWDGGIFIKYSSVTTVQDAEAFRVRRIVEKADPTTVVGFLLRGSLEASDTYTAQYPGMTGIATMCNHGSYLFKYYEADTFVLNQTVYCSANGLLTNVNAGGARAVGVVMGLPADNSNYLGVDVIFP